MDTFYPSNLFLLHSLYFSLFVHPTCVQGLLYHIVVGTQGPPLQAFISAGFSPTQSPPPPPSLTPPWVRHTTSLLCTPGPHCAEHWWTKWEIMLRITVKCCECLFLCFGARVSLTVWDQLVKYQLVTQGPMLHSSLPCGRALELHSLSFTMLPWSLTQRTLLVLLPTPQSTEHCDEWRTRRMSMSRWTKGHNTSWQFDSLLSINSCFIWSQKGNWLHNSKTETHDKHINTSYKYKRQISNRVHKLKQFKNIVLQIMNSFIR